MARRRAGPHAGPYDPGGRRPARSFRDVTCVEIAKDGMVYVCDRTSNRIQVFDKSGKFVKEMVIAKDTGGATVALGGGCDGRHFGARVGVGRRVLERRRSSGISSSPTA